MIVNDQKLTTLVAASALALCFFIPLSAGARTNDGAPAQNMRAASASSTAVTFVAGGAETGIVTNARTVGELLVERGIPVAAEDFVSPAADQPLSDGLRVEYRPAVSIEINDRGIKRTVRSAAETVAELLAEQRIGTQPGDDIDPLPASHLTANEAVQIVHVVRWTSSLRQRIAPATKQRTDANLVLGISRIVDRGTAGVREMTVRYVRRNDGATQRTVLASRIVRQPRPRIIVRGIAAYQSLAHVAQQGFESAMHFAGSALHMIATAYSASCYGCSGVTASGVRAGFGVIAVDPSVIPLGTKLFIPGYGRAVAGDTGGAIHGHRIDLGFDSNTAAMNWGDRPVTVYLLR